MSRSILNKQNSSVFRNNTGLKFFNIIETLEVLFLVFKEERGLMSQLCISEVTIITEVQKLCVHTPHICLKQLAHGHGFCHYLDIQQIVFENLYSLWTSQSKIKCLVSVLQIMLSRKQYIVNNVYFIGQTSLVLYWT